MLIKLTDDKYVEVDENDQARVVVKSELEKQVKQLMKQISNGSQVDYKGLSLKERIKVCVDIIFA